MPAAASAAAAWRCSAEWLAPHVYKRSLHGPGGARVTPLWMITDRSIPGFSDELWVEWAAEHGCDAQALHIQDGKWHTGIAEPPPDEATPRQDVVTQQAKLHTVPPIAITSGLGSYFALKHLETYPLAGLVCILPHVPGLAHPPAHHANMPDAEMPPVNLEPSPVPILLIGPASGPGSSHAAAIAQAHGLAAPGSDDAVHLSCAPAGIQHAPLASLYDSEHGPLDSEDIALANAVWLTHCDTAPGKALAFAQSEALLDLIWTWVDERA